MRTEINALPQLLQLVEALLPVAAVVIAVPRPVAAKQKQAVDLLGDLPCRRRRVHPARVLLQVLVQAEEGVVDGALRDVAAGGVFVIVVGMVGVAPGRRRGQALREVQRLRRQEGRLVRQDRGRRHGVPVLLSLL